MLINIGIIVTISLFIIGWLINLYKEISGTKNKSLKETDKNISTRVTQLEKNYVDDIKAEKNYITREEFLTEMKEFKIEIKAQFTELKTEVKRDMCDLGKKIDTLTGNTVTKEECSEKRKAMTGIL